MKPLILTADEVRAALAGTLTEIRRPVDMRGIRETAWITRCSVDPETHEAEFSGDVDYFVRRVACPFGAPGTVLWVKEAFWVEHDWDSREMAGSFDCGIDLADSADMGFRVQYPATPNNPERPDEPGDWYGPDEPDENGWCVFPERTWMPWGEQSLGPFFFSRRPCICMPKWASRLALVTRAVRVERADVWTWIASVEVVRKPNGEPMPPREVQR